jgi:cytochrome c oxidase subunit 2
MINSQLSLAAIIGAASLSGCDGVQSVLAPQGPAGARIAVLAWVLFGTGAAILLAVLLAIGFALRGSQPMRARLGQVRAVAVFGIAVPTVVLTILLVCGVWLTQAGVPAGEGADPIRIEVVGEQWWWRVGYLAPDGRKVANANEIRIPVNRAVEFALTSADVIHSFWVPSLGGKVDMIPGRTTNLRLLADRPGVFRGQCAEYCGGPHALMALEVIALPPSEYEAWLAAQVEPAAEPTTEAGKLGKALFLSSGCGACHAIRGTPASGSIGPDLTHLGSRRMLAAGWRPTSQEHIARFIAGNQLVKPGNRMPPFGIFAPTEMEAIAGYLESLR